MRVAALDLEVRLAAGYEKAASLVEAILGARNRGSHDPRFYSHEGFEAPLRRIRFKDPEPVKTLIFLTNNFLLPALTITELFSLASRALLQNGSSSICVSSFLRNFGEGRQVTNLDRRLPLRPGRHRQETIASIGQPV